MRNPVPAMPVPLAVMLVLAACSVPPSSVTAPPSGALASGCADDGAGPPGADSLMIWVDSGGAYGPPQDWTKAWELAAYRDGTVLRSQGFGLNQAPLSPTTIDRVDHCLVERTAEQLRALAAADVQVPLPTDMSTTVVSLRDGAHAPVTELHIYGLGEESWRPDDIHAGDPDRIDRAIENRQAVIDLLAGLDHHPRPATPDRLRVVERTGEPYGYQPPTLTWPFGSFDEVMARRATVPACAEISGTDVPTLIAALGNAPAQSRWSDPYRTTMVAAAPLMPGQPGCPS